MIQASPKQQLETRWIRIVTFFLWLSLLWSIVEGSSSTYLGYMQNDLSLFAFGVDSWIEVLSAALVLYHMACKSLPQLRQQRSQSTTPLTESKLNSSALFSLETERQLTLFIGSLLIIFCLFACVGGGYRLYVGTPPDDTRFGIYIGSICVVAMFIMWYYKTKASVILNSATLGSDAACSFGCCKLSLVLLAGSVAYYFDSNLWWVDAVTAILIGLLVGYEGFETVKKAKDKATFKGGCGCCGASDTGLAKYFRKKFSKQLAAKSADSDGIGSGLSNADDHCCDSSMSHGHDGSRSHHHHHAHHSCCNEHEHENENIKP